jgi:ketosteroid isomerase-like protein
MTDNANVTLVREYLAAISRGETGDAMKRFYDPGFEQTEFPNVLNPKGQHSDLADSLARAEKGKKLLSAQTYDVRSAIGAGDSVALEVDWTGTLAIPALGLPAGGKMKAHFAMFLEMRSGKIWRQRNYDCFEPWT